MRIVSCLLLAGLASCRPQDSYLAPAASEAVSLYSSPSEVVETYDEAADLFDLPQQGLPELVLLPTQASYGLPQQDSLSEEATSSQAIATSYGQPQDDVITAPAASSSYGQPRSEVLSGGGSSRIVPTAGRRVNKARGKLQVFNQPAATAPADNIVFFAPSEPAAAVISSYGQPLADNSLEAESQVREVAVASGRALSSFSTSTSTSSNSLRREPEKILRSEFSGPNEGNWNYAYETENGIKQEARGEVRTIGDAQVSVMSGSYSYIGADGLTYVVDWYADETGFHPTAPHLPKSVEPDHPEVAAAVKEQLRFAAQEEAAAASEINSVRVLADNPNARRANTVSRLVEDDLDDYRPDTVSSYSIAEFSL